MTELLESTVSFGYWVRRRRKALDLTQEALAQQVGCAAVTLRKIEAGERQPSPEMAQRLMNCLEGRGEHEPAYVAALSDAPGVARLVRPAGRGARQPANRLPVPVTSLVGRSEEIAAIVEAILHDQVRLLTLTGPIGVGKTRLALEAGRRLQPAFSSDVFLVSLAPVQDPALVPAVTASALGVREDRAGDLSQSLVHHLANRQTLLIFDNFEHLLPAARFLARLLTTCPSLHILVTSRARLHLYGEHEVMVHPLSLPAKDDLQGAANTAAVQLFCDRAQATQAGFQLTPSLTPIVAEICRRLDGLPLAIELAAARLRLLSLQELQGRLEHRFLSSRSNGPDGRQQGLERAIAWSHGLLTPAERALLARLAVFAGGFCLEAAEAICADPPGEPAGGDGELVLSAPEVAASVDALLDQSLLARGTLGGASYTVTGCCGRCALRALRETTEVQARFSMLEIIRQFARVRLQASGELEAMQRRHADYFAAWSEQVAARLNGPDQAGWLARLEMEADNLRAALGSLLESGQTASAAGMACALGSFWQRHGHYSEGRRWLEQVLAQMMDRRMPEGLRARTLQTAASLAYRQGDWQAAQGWLAESLALYRAGCDRSGEARVLYDLGWIAIDRAEWAEATRLNQASLALARAAGDTCATYQALTNLGWAQLCTNDWDAATAQFEEAYEIAHAMGHTKGIAVALANRAWVALHGGDAPEAAGLARNSLRLCHLLGEQEVMAECLEILAATAAVDGDVNRSLELDSAAETLWKALRVTRPPTRRATALTARSWLVRPAARELGRTTPAEARPSSPDTLVALALNCGGAPASGATDLLH